MCLKQATLQYDENYIWQFLKMTLFGVTVTVLATLHVHNFKSSGRLKKIAPF